MTKASNASGNAVLAKARALAAGTVRVAGTSGAPVGTPPARGTDEGDSWAGSRGSRPDPGAEGAAESEVVELDEDELLSVGLDPATEAFDRLRSQLTPSSSQAPSSPSRVSMVRRPPPKPSRVTTVPSGSRRRSS